MRRVEAQSKVSFPGWEGLEYLGEGFPEKVTLELSLKRMEFSQGRRKAPFQIKGTTRSKGTEERNFLGWGYKF